MRILADENFPRPVVEAMRERGHDVLWARTDCPGLTDAALLERAEVDGRVVFTLDHAFWRSTLQRLFPLEDSGLVLFRVLPAHPEDLEPLVDSALQSDRPRIGHLSIVGR